MPWASRWLEIAFILWSDSAVSEASTPTAFPLMRRSPSLGSAWTHGLAFALFSSNRRVSTIRSLRIGNPGKGSIRNLPLLTSSPTRAISAKTMRPFARTPVVAVPAVFPRRKAKLPSTSRWKFMKRSSSDAEAGTVVAMTSQPFSPCEGQ